MEQHSHSEIIQPLSHYSVTDQDHNQSGSVLRLIYEFQNQLTLQELFNVYAENICTALPIDGIRYRFPLLAINLQHGMASNPICNYQLNTEHDVWGEITIYRNKGFSSDEIHQFELITSLLVHPLKMAILHVSASLYTDDGGVVGLANPGLVDQLIIREAKLAAREHVPMSVVLFNADRFRRISDSFGHIHGDKILYDIMQVMYSKLRDTDLLFRYDADNFFLILKGVTGDQAMMISERVRSAVDVFSFRQTNNKRLHMTISAGIAVLNKQDCLDSILKRAKNALLLAKKSGRNQSILADGIFIN